MTRERDRLCLCPNCGKFYAFSESISVNFSGWRQWSDGWGCGRLYSRFTQLLGCNCGTLFWPSGMAFKVRNHNLSDIIEIDMERLEEKTPAPKSWWGGLFDSLAGSCIGSSKLDFLVHKRREYPLIFPAKISKLYDVLFYSKPNLDHKTELEIRQWLWWVWNHRNRDLIVKPSDIGPDVPDSEKEANLHRLAALLETADQPCWMMIGDAYRQLGEFNSAIDAYVRANETGTKEYLIGLAKRQCRECVEFNPTFKENGTA